MKINVDDFKNVLKKGTMNWIMDSIGLSVNKSNIKCNMISSDRNAVLFLNLPNTMIEGIKSDEILNFTEPNVKVKPYLDILDDNLVPLVITDEKLIIDKKLKINFDDESVISKYGKDNPINEIIFFIDINIDDDFKSKFDKIKKIGGKFGKIYFVVENNKLYIESTDKTNSYSNSLKYEICDCNHEDCILCFKYKNLVSLMTLIDDDFKFKLSYVKENNLGALGIFKIDESERYFLMSVMDND